MAVQISNLVYEPVTDGLDPVHERILNAVEAKIVLLDLEGVEQVIALKAPFDERLTLPCVVVTAFDRAEAMSGVVNTRDDLGYPVFLGFYSRDPQDQTSRARGLLWRQKVSRAFRHQRLSGVTEVMTCEVEPEAVFDAFGSGSGYQFLQSTMTLRFLAREVRGFGA